MDARQIGFSVEAKAGSEDVWQIEESKGVSGRKYILVSGGFWKGGDSFELYTAAEHF